MGYYRGSLIEQFEIINNRILIESNQRIENEKQCDYICSYLKKYGSEILEGEKIRLRTKVFNWCIRLSAIEISKEQLGFSIKDYM